MPGNVEPARVVLENKDASRYEVEVDCEVAFLAYERRKRTIVLVHTEVPPSLRGGGLGELLARHALDAAQAEGTKVIVQCPFVQAWLRDHPEYSGVVLWPRL